MIHSKFESKRSCDCVEWFINKLKEIAQTVNYYVNRIIPMVPLTNEQKRDFYTSIVCHMCNKSFSTTDAKHRDHDHFTGKYRGAAHQGCNVNYKKDHHIPIVFHNLSGYDSLRFMASSLEKLTPYLNDVNKCIARKECSNSEEFKLLTRKGLFPYEYVNSWNRLEKSQLPPKDKFYSKLTNEEIYEEDYIHAVRVWNKFNIESLGEYSDLYLKTDVLLLADIFENFRRNCLATYALDPLHYYTAPGLAFDAMLKYTRVALELLTDPEMLLFIEKGIRGGVAQCSNRYAEANNRYMGEYFDSSREESYLM